jgi:hypothetical protein
MDSIFPIKLAPHLTNSDLGNLHDQGIQITHIGVDVYAVCRDLLDERVVQNINCQPVIKDYYESI